MARPAALAAVSVERFFQFAMLGMVASGYLAVAGSGYLDTPTILLAGAGLVLRGLAIAGTVRLAVADRTITVATLLYAVFFGLDYLALSRDFLQCTVHLVFFLAVVKILTARSGRDYLYTAAIALMELLAAAILSVNLNFFLFLGTFLLCAMAALTSGEIRRSMGRAEVAACNGVRRFHPRLAVLAVFLSSGILGLTGVLFFVLPRTADAALARLISHRILLPGFSNQVTLGEIGEVKITSRPVMHVRMFARQVPEGLKWRGGSLADFDGKRWSNPPGEGTPIPLEGGQVRLRDTFAGRALNYHVDLSVLETDALFFAGTPVTLEMRSPLVYRTPTGAYRLGTVPVQGFHYDTYSVLETPPEQIPPRKPPPLLPLAERERFLQLPRLDARIPALARQMAEPAATELARARAIEYRLSHDYRYSLQLPKQEAADPLADFLFRRRQGHCEYFASSMTVMLRTLGIPARIVNGFQSGVWNPFSELWVIRASDAHSWVEAWVPGYGWTTFDPTPPDPAAGAVSLWTRLALYADAADTFWQEWVVSYDLSRQGTLADKVEQRARRMGVYWFDGWGEWGSQWKLRATGALHAYGLRALAVAVAAFWIWLLGPRLLRIARTWLRVRRVRRGQASVADATLLYERMLHLMRRRGYQKPAWLTPREFAGSLPESEACTLVGEFTTAYNAVRFGGQTEVAPALSVLLDRLEKS